MNGSVISILLFIAGALLEGWLAAMLLLTARALRVAGTGWLRWLAAGFMCNALRSAAMGLGYGDVALDAVPTFATAALAALSLGCITAGLIDYATVPPHIARRLKRAGAAVLAAMVAATLPGWITRWEGYVVSAIFVLAWALLMLYLVRREPRGGHGAVVGALVSFPAASIALREGVVPADLLPLLEIVPLCSLGFTVLTTGLIRAHRRAQHEAAQAALALQAREQAEAQLRAANETLEHHVAMRTAELRETIEGLESFNRSVSHDLRGPLGGIAGVAQLAREHMADGNPGQADRMLAAIKRQADASMQTLASLLALARAGDAQPRRAPVDVAALVGEVVAAQRVPETAQVTVQPLPTIGADRELLRQVFVNLIGNACKFAADAAQPAVVVGHVPRADGDAFFVRDNGVGFSEADTERLFKPFQRLHGARFEGSGVGLSIVRRIVDHHGGRVWAEGAPGAGATFWFTLGAG